ncbi:MAG: carbohydrate-binding protein [Candidatus Symbiothrix sp.]|jgi:predicted alpha-1,6-mannanase (GH76 family)|nr:carbohydrate-binding protein [Candidatus Symbiothrix sp.]
MKRFLLSILLLVFFTNWIQATDIIDGVVYKITTCSAGNKTLSVKNSALEYLAPVVTWTDTDVNAQRWRVTKDETGDYYYLTNIYSGKVLHMNGNAATVGAVVNQYNFATSKSCKWEITPVEGNEDGFYITQSLLLNGEKIYLEVAGSSESSSISLYQKKTEDNASRQIWKFEAVEKEPNVFTATVRDKIMQDWKNQYYKPATVGHIFAPGGWWDDAEMLEIILDAYETTSDAAHQEMFEELYSNFIARNRSNWLYNEYNDDIAWMVIACTRAYLLFGDTHYLQRAQTNFDQMYARALLPSGMLRWKETPVGNTGTNSCIDGPAEVAACYLALATGTESYYEKARDLYALQRQHLYVPSTGRVYDWYHSDDGSYGDWASTYNQGTFLGAALMLYNHYGTEQYKEDAQKIVEYTRKNMCNAQGIINVCGSGDDLSGFKGILMRYLRRFIVDLAQPDWVDWMQTNVLQAYNNRNSKGILWTAWWEKTSEDFIFDNYNYTEKPFGSSTAVSAAFNTPLDKNWIIKDAFAKIEAENFNYLKGVYTQSDDSEVTYIGNIQTDYWTAYNNVDFGDKFATSIQFKVASATNSGTIEVRKGSVDGDLIGTATIPATANDEWTTVTCAIEPTGGKQNIYLVYKGTGNLFNLDYFQFIGEETKIQTLNQEENGIKIYPNPADKLLNIAALQNGKIAIYNSVGKLRFSGNTSQGLTCIDVSGYEKGAYIVKLTAGYTVLAQHFIKK